MGKLVVVYGTESELEEGLSKLQAAGLGDATRVVQRPPAGNEEADVEAGEELAEGGAVPVVVPASATLGTGVPLGTPAPVAPHAFPAGPAGTGVGAVGWTGKEIEDLTDAHGDEARHLHDVVAGGGSLLVVDGDEDLVDAAEAALAGHTGQGAVRR